MEQWEIDLRNQISGASKKNKNKNTNVFKEEIQDFLPKAKNKKRDTSLMLSLLIILGLSSIFVYEYKTDPRISYWVQSVFAKEKEELESLIPSLEFKDSNELKEKVEKLENQSISLQTKVNLLGILFNENVAILRNNYGELIFFNKDWTIHGMPSHIILTDEEVQYLKNYVNKN